jgi:hypothetical protein
MAITKMRFLQRKRGQPTLAGIFAPRERLSSSGRNSAILKQQIAHLEGIIAPGKNA